jgi:hypothetical protein
VVASCGNGEPTFDPEGFVREANAHGAGLVLGSSLPSSREDAEVRELSLDESEDHATSADQPHGGGSLTVMRDSDEAVAEWERCESSASLICFRAANVVLIFEGSLTPADHARIEQALRALASD